MNIDEHLGSTRRTALLIYVALCMSLVMHVVVAFIVATEDKGAAVTADIALIQQAMTLAAVVVGGLSALAPRFLLSDRMLEQLLSKAPNLEQLARRNNGPIDAERLRALQAMDTSTVKLLPLAQRWMTTVILSVALAEAVEIFGLVLALITKEPMRIVPFAAAAAVLMASHFPRLDPVIERAKRLQRL